MAKCKDCKKKCVGKRCKECFKKALIDNKLIRSQTHSQKKYKLKTEEEIKKWLIKKHNYTLKQANSLMNWVKEVK